MVVGALILASGPFQHWIMQSDLDEDDFSVVW